jgi:predicted transcriptional regulator
VASSTAKDLLKEAVEQLPENASIEDAMERLVFLSKIQRGREDVEAGRVISHEDAKYRLGL